MGSISPVRLHFIILLPLFSVVFTLSGFGQQLEVQDAGTPPLSPENLIENIFLGSGVEIMSVTYEGDPRAVGLFNSGDQDINLNRGIILSTGFAADATKPNGYPSSDPDAGGATSAGSVVDDDLANLTPGNLSDITKFEIKFRPFGDTLRFRYVFASEEYPTFTCLTYNDVFGFFISGPNPGGGSYNAENIAIVPGTNNTPVSINNVHNGNPFIPQPGCIPVNEEFYNDNTGSNSLVYNAYLDVFTAVAAVVPCELYTIKIAIGDGSASGNDNNYDSAVFLEAKSFETGSLEVEATTLSLDGSLAEGCSAAALNFKIPTPLTADLPLNYSVSGTAANGIDYQLIPANLAIPAGDTIATLPIRALEDNIAEGTETIIIEVISTSCKKDTFEFFIREDQLIAPALGPDQEICAGNSIQLMGSTAQVVDQPKQFANTAAVVIPDRTSPFSPVIPVYSEIVVSGVEPPNLVPGLIRSVCLNISHASAGELDIFLLSPGGQYLELSTDNGDNGSNFTGTCFTPDAGISITGSGQYAPATMAPFFGNFLPEGPWSDLWDGQNPSNGSWRLVIMDDQVNKFGLLLDWSITFNPANQLNYDWTPGATLSCQDCPEPLASPAATTEYYYTIADSYGCTASDSIIVVVPESLPAPSVQCVEQSSSTITFEWDPVAGATGYQVNVDESGWTDPNHGSRSHRVSGLVLDQSVTLEVKGIGPCGALSASSTCIAAGCPIINVGISHGKPISCNGGSDGVLNVNASGGVSPYTFDIGTASNTTGVFSNIEAGKYVVTVTDASGCSQVDSINFPEPAILTLEGSAYTESCDGAEDGRAVMTPGGGTPNYNFQWDSSAGNQTTGTAYNLDGGTYFVTVTDFNGCSAEGSVTVPDAVAVIPQISGVDPSCESSRDGQATVSVAGNQGPYTFKWNDSKQQTTATAVGLGAGNYAVTVTDKNGCTARVQQRLNAPAAFQISVSTKFSSCYNSSDGQASLSVAGATPPYSFQWSDGGTSTMMRSDLAPGEHQVTIFDSRGCSDIKTFTIFSPPDINIEVSMQPTSCFGSTDGTATALATGGGGGLQYQWNDDANQNSATASNLGAGIYSVTATDASGCTIVGSIEVTQPDPLRVDIDPSHVTCHGSATGSASAIVTGGTGSYRYSWNDPNLQATATAFNLGAGKYAVTVTDDAGCQASANITVVEPEPLTTQMNWIKAGCADEPDNEIQVIASGGTRMPTEGYQYRWSDANAQTAQIATGLAPGKYFVTVIDQNQCSAVDSLVVTAASPLQIGITATDVLCHGAQTGELKATANGGTGDLEYKWSNGRSGNTLISLRAGSYCLTVTDENGCIAQSCATVQQPSEIKANPSLSTADCSGSAAGVITLDPVGGQGTYSYQWEGPNNFTSQARDIRNLPSGEYTITLTDGAGCQYTETVFLADPSNLEINFEISHVNCFGESTGALTALVSGGASNYTYQWSTGSTEAKIVDLPSGLYNLSITDGLGCTLEKTAQINEPSDPLKANVSIEDISCHGADNGSVVFEASGGTPIYRYSVDGVSFEPYAATYGLKPGNYDFQVRDSKGCVVAYPATLTNPSPVVVDLGPDISLELGTSIDLTAEIKNSTGNLDYQWSAFDESIFSCTDCPSPTLLSNFTTSLTLEVQDELGCRGKDELQLIIKKDRALYVPTGFSPNSDKNNDRLVVHGKAGTRIISFRIYDRWGELIFEQLNFKVNDEEFGWDGTYKGKEVKSGIFIWQAEVEFIDGFQNMYKGETTLIR